LINLLVNAIKFTSSAARRIITLTLDATTERPCLTGDSLNESPTIEGMVETGSVNLVFEVKDTGIGMTEAEIQRVFQRFVQGSNRTHLTYGGSGLGKIVHLEINMLISQVYLYAGGLLSYLAVR
jgi:signal transduction histidine kinase